jgi:hypothetical protein
MMSFKSLCSTAAVAAGIALGAPVADRAQISIGVNLGAPPVCPYGYFDYAPYNCAPYGYYGPDWFNGGVFIGAGPWFHGPHGFYGHVDNRFDPHNGYHGPLPDRGAVAYNHFQGNEARDGQGHIGTAPHPATNEHAMGGPRMGGGAPHGGGGRR